MRTIDEYFALICPNGSIAGDGGSQVTSHIKGNIETNLDIEKYVSKFGEEEREMGLGWIQFLREMNNLTENQSFRIAKIRVTEIEDIEDQS